MPWIPYVRVTLESLLSPDEMRQRLAASLTSPTLRLGNVERPRTPLYGSVSPDGFTAWKVIRYRNSFVPVARGRWRIEGRATHVDLRLTLHPFVLYFMAIWMSLPLFSGVVLTVAALARGHLTPVVLIPLAFAAAGYALATAGFRWEYRDTIAQLAACLDARVIWPDGAAPDPFDR